MQERELCNIAFPKCICRLTLAWISSEISTKLLGMPTHLDQSSLTALDSLLCRLVTSAVRCRLHLLPPCLSHRQLTSVSSFVQLLSRSLPTYGRVEISSPNPLVSRQNRQRNRLLGGPPTWCHKYAGRWNCLELSHL